LFVNELQEWPTFSAVNFLAGELCTGPLEPTDMNVIPGIDEIPENRVVVVENTPPPLRFSEKLSSVFLYVVGSQHPHDADLVVVRVSRDAEHRE
jgi:hypothetical protein